MSRVGSASRHLLVTTVCLLPLWPRLQSGAQEALEADLSGRVSAADTGEELSGVVVEIPALARRTVSGPGGEFVFDDVPAGTHAVRFALPGRRDRSATVTVAPPAAARVDVALELGQPLVMEEVVVTATRTERTSFDVPAPVGVLDEQEIARRQADAPGDLFPLEPGVEVEGAGPFLGLPVIRGLSGNRVLVLVDGQRLNNAREAINFGGVQPSLVDLGDVEEIEITRGPASVLYGTDAIGGIVNVITRRPALPDEGVVAGGKARTRYSTADEQRSARLDLHVAGSRLGLRLSGGLREAEDYDSALGEVANSGAETSSLNAELAWRPATGHRLRLELQRFRGDDIGIPGTGGVFTGFFPSTDRDKVALRYEGTGLGPVASLSASAYVQDQEEDFATRLDVPPIPAGPFDLLIDTETSRLSDVRTVGFDLQAHRPLGSAHLLTAGVELFRDDVEETRLEVSTQAFQPRVPGPPGRVETAADSIPTTPDGSFQGLGVFVQDELRAGRVALIPGLRFDRFDIETDALLRPEGDVPAEDRAEEALSGSLGLLVGITESLHLTASAGRAFRTPNLIERFFFGPGSQGGLSVPNPDLDDETSLNLDAGLKLQARGVRGAVTYFRNEIDDFITFVPATFEGDSSFGGQPVTSVDNVGDARIQGVEAELEVRAALGRSTVSVFGVYTGNRGDNLSAGGPVFVPPAKGVLGVLWSDGAARFSAGLTSRFVNGQERVPAGIEKTAGFSVFDLHGAIDLEPLFRQDALIRIGVENLTDKAYAEPLGDTLAPGRSLVVGLEVGFEAPLAGRVGAR